MLLPFPGTGMVLSLSIPQLTVNEEDVAKDAQARFVQWGHLRSLSKWEKGKKESK